MNDPRDNRIYQDENGNKWLTDENGKILTDESGNKIPPQNSSREGWGYDTSQGHCFSCGRLTCRGGCMMGG
jgi:hypothetical protein